jgi:phage terminase large subunit-like protein
MTLNEIVLKYCHDVINDTLPNRKTCRFEKLACRRHLDDLEKSKSEDYPYEFDERSGRIHVNFMQRLHHTKDEWRGTLIKLEPHQLFMHYVLFGWIKKRTKHRRFTKAFFEIPRKNGKSLAAAGIGLFMAFADNKQGSEVYCGALTEKQALCVFEPAFQMAKINTDLIEAYGLTLAGTEKNPSSIYRLEDMSRFEPVIGKPGDGTSPTCAICDEYHESPTSILVDTMKTGMGARREPLLLIITTAGFDTSFPCYDEHLQAIKILEGTLEKDNVFCILYGIDDGDDWADFEVWKKANPNYLISIDEDSLKESYLDACNNLKDRNTLLCKHLNIWCNSSSAWMDMQKFELCKRPNLKLEDFYGQEVWIGIDLANKIDLCAMQLLFRLPDGSFATFGKYYLPEEVVNKKENSHYQLWRDEGILISTEGAVTDFFKIEEDLKELNKLFIIKELDFDQKEAHFWVQTIQLWADFECVEIPQSAQFISEPMKTLESLIYDGKMLHDGNKLLTWSFGNVVSKLSRGSSSVKYYYPTKQTNANKIDPVCALIMALSRALLSEDIGDSYNQRAKAGIEDVLRVI